MYAAKKQMADKSKGPLPAGSHIPVLIARPFTNGRKESSMGSILSNLGAILFLFVAGGTIVAFIGGGILLTFISLNEYLKSIDR